MAPTHIVFGVFSTTGLFALFSLSLHRDLPALGATIIGSLLPDIDSPRSSVGRLLPFLSIPIERRWGHRTVTHCLLATGLLGVILLPICFWQTTVYAALLLGYLSHLLADCATKSGVPLFHPHPTICVLPGNSKYRVRTGSMAEQGVLLALLFMLALVFPLSSLGGTWRAIRYVMATQGAAYSDFRESSTEMMLDFKGRWRVSREVVEGKALILDGTQSRFLIAFEGATRVYGEQGDILPDRSRVKSTGAPIRIDTLSVQAWLYPRVLDQIPTTAYVSGQLQSEQPFQPRPRRALNAGLHQSVKIAGQSLQFDFAPRAHLAQFRPIHQADPERLTQAQQSITQAEQALKTLQLQRPPAHYLKLREAQTALTERKDQFAELQDTTVLFSGRLFLRLPGGNQ